MIDVTALELIIMFHQTFVPLSNQSVQVYHSVGRDYNGHDHGMQHTFLTFMTHANIYYPYLLHSHSFWNTVTFFNDNVESDTVFWISYCWKLFISWVLKNKRVTFTANRNVWPIVDQQFSCILRDCISENQQGCYTSRLKWTQGKLRYTGSIRISVISN